MARILEKVCSNDSTPYWAVPNMLAKIGSSRKDANARISAPTV